MWPWAAGLGPGWAGPGQGPSARAWAEQRASLCWQGCTTPARFGLLLRLLHLLPAVPVWHRAPAIGVGGRPDQIRSDQISSDQLSVVGTFAASPFAATGAVGSCPQTAGARTTGLRGWLAGHRPPNLTG